MDLQKFQEAYEANTASSKHDFRFVTDLGIQYVIFTLPGERLIPGFIFSHKIIYLSFRPLGEYKIPYKDRKRSFWDEKRINTIFNFIIDILEDKNAIIAFNPSPEEGKKELRQKLFNIYYIRHHQNMLYKMDFEFPRIGTASVIFRKDNDYCADICTTTDDDILKK